MISFRCQGGAAVRLDGLILLVPARSDPERDAVAAAWRAGGGTVQALDRFWEVPALAPAQVRLYGNDTFCLVVAQKLGLQLISPPDDLLLQLGPSWSKRTVIGQSLSAALAGPFPLFVKPLVPKVFRAAVHASAESLQQECAGLEGETPVLCSEIITIQAEARAWIRQGQVRTCAIYEGEGNAEEAADFLAGVTAHGAIPATCVLDAGLIPGRGWALIEANATWGAGLNGCDAAEAAQCLALATRSD